MDPGWIILKFQFLALGDRKLWWTGDRNAEVGKSQDRVSRMDEITLGDSASLTKLTAFSGAKLWNWACDALNPCFCADECHSHVPNEEAGSTLFIVRTEHNNH